LLPVNARNWDNPDLFKYKLMRMELGIPENLGKYQYRRKKHFYQCG
jgi:hypothetical protein